MKKKIGLKIFIPMIIALIVVIPMLVSGKDYGAEYDKIFGKEEGFTIHTNETIDESSGYLNNQLEYLVGNFARPYYTNHMYEDGTEFYYAPYTDGCNYDDKTCNIKVYKVLYENGMESSRSVFKSYDNVKININSDVMDYFGTVLNSNGDMIINYDESMFADENEKSDYNNAKK